jgi:hypothetical protein
VQCEVPQAMAQSYVEICVLIKNWCYFLILELIMQAWSASIRQPVVIKLGYIFCPAAAQGQVRGAKFFLRI